MLRPLLVLLGCLLLPAAIPARAAPPKASDEILSALQTRLETGDPFDDLLEQLDSLEPADLKKLHADFDQVWPQLRNAYLAAFQAEAKSQNSGPARQERQKTIRQLRAEFMEVGGMPEGPMNDALQARSWPAVEQLRDLLLPSAERVLKLGGKELAAQRDQILRLGTFRDGMLKAAVAIEPPDSVKLLQEREIAIAKEFSDLDRDGLRVMEKNRKLAEEVELPEPERVGIEDLNLMRLLVGLPALALDPKLCDASRGHSEDMNKLGFFSHTSPVPGKASFTDRARLAGTSGNGENIYVGSADPLSANKGWFFSPGHHKNMFSGSHTRVGLGNYGAHWTQMFGG